MNKKNVGFLAAALFLGPMVAAAQAVIYDYTGVVYSSNETAVPIGTQVSGTYTFDLSNDIPASGYWAQSGPSLFSSTLRAGTFDYATPIPNPPAPFVATEVAGSHSGATPLFFANESWLGGSPLFPDDFSGGSELEIGNLHGAWTRAGLPNFAGAQYAWGQVELFPQHESSPEEEIFYNITSLMRAPELDPTSAAGGLELLLCGLAMVIGSKSIRRIR